MDFYTNVAVYGNQILVRGVQNGERINTRVKYEPTLFVPVQKDTGWKTLEGKNLLPYHFDSIKEAKEFISQYENQKHLVFGLDRFAYTYLADEFENKSLKWDMEKMMVVTIDIEVACENGFPNPMEAIEPLLSITIKNQQTKKFLVWGTGEFETDRDDVTYIKCSDERELILEFLAFWSSHQPDVVTGWNTDFFDIPYICNRVKVILGEDRLKDLSPWGLVSSRTVTTMGRPQQVYEITGVAQLDYLELYRKFTYTNQESYRLDHIGHVELGIRKDDNPYETFREWYTKDYQSFIEYNIQDVELVDQLEDKLGLISLALTMAYEAKVNFSDVFGQVKYWDVLIYNYLRQRKIAIPQKISHSKSEKFVGAYVKEPQVGEHKWVMSFDLNSLYPHLIMQYNISPETLMYQQISGVTVDRLLNEDVPAIPDGMAMVPNGALFRTNERGFLPQMMQEMYDDRKIYKKKMLDAKQKYEDTKDPKYLKDVSRFNNIQMARKISLNSAYGAIGNEYFRYFDLRIAEGITSGGQLSIRWIEKKINEYLNNLLETEGEDYVIASDTDSVYIRFDKLVDKVLPKGDGVSEDDYTAKVVEFLDRVASKKLEPFIDKSYQDLALMMQAYDQKMQMAREAIADKGIWTAKKRYILNVYDMEGVRYQEPHLKIMGIEAVKSSTPAPCREKIKDALKIIMRGTEKELNDFVCDFRDQFMEMEPEQIAFPRSCNGLGKFSESSAVYKKGTPMHVKGALLYNMLVDREKLSAKYPKIQEGDKIKFFYLRQPNPIASNVFSFITKTPVEVDIHKYIDYDTQFDKAFVEPMSFILEKIQWQIDRTYGTQGSLEDFFS